MNFGMWMENGSPALQAAGRASAHISGFWWTSHVNEFINLEFFSN